jgi:hypothetical protein
LASVFAAGAAAPAPDTNYAEKLIEEVHRDIAVDDRLLKEARRRRNLVTGTAVKFPGALRSYSSGSVAAGLVIHDVEDADGGLVLDRRVYPDLCPDGDGVGPTRIVGDVADYVLAGVRGQYSDAEVEIGRRSIKVSFNEDFDGHDPYVDLIVALTRRENPGLWIPQLEDEIWDASDPEKHTELFVSKSIAKSLRVYRARVVRLGKACLKQDDEPAIASFHFGALTLKHISEPVPETLIEGLQRVFERGASELGSGSDTEDPAGVSDPIKLDQPRYRVVERLNGFARGLQEAIDHSDDEDAARDALSRILPDYIDPPKGSAKHSIASELRRGSSGLAVATGFGPSAAQAKKPRSFGDAP